jgi:hypothetical protein
MKTQILRSAFLLLAALLITGNNNAGKLEFQRFSINNMVENNSVAMQNSNVSNEHTNPYEPDIHFHIFDIDKDERLLVAWKIKATKWSVVIYDILMLTGFHFALYILPIVAQQYH